MINHFPACEMPVYREGLRRLDRSSLSLAEKADAIGLLADVALVAHTEYMAKLYADGAIYERDKVGGFRDRLTERLRQTGSAILSILPEEGREIAESCMPNDDTTSLTAWDANPNRQDPIFAQPEINARAA